MARELCNAEAVFNLMSLGFSYTEAAAMGAQDAQTFIGFGIRLGRRQGQPSDKPARQNSDNGQTKN